MVRLLLGLALLFIAAVAGGALAVIGSSHDLADVRLEGTRTALPGARTVALEARRYNVLYEVPDSVEDDEPIPVPPDLRVAVRARGSERAVLVRDYTGTFTTSSGGRSARAIGTIHPARAGRYVLSARLLEETPPRGASVVLGEPIGRRVVRMVAAALLVVLSGIGLLVVGVVALVRAVRTDPPTGTPTP